MKVLQGLFFLLLGLVALFFVTGLFLPQTAHVERSMTTTASPTTVYGLVDGCARFNEWSPWASLDPGRRVTHKLDFGMDNPTTSTISLVPEGTGTRVTWTLDTDFSGSLIGRYFGLALDRMVGPDYEKGLAQLKAVAETATVPNPQ